MRMKRFWKVIPLLALALACQEEQEDPREPVAPVTPPAPPAEEIYKVFYGTIDNQAQGDSKAYVDANMDVLWNAGDRISVFRKVTGNQEFCFQGTDGADTGSFEEVVTTDPSGDALPYYYAVYPYASTTSIATNGTISLTLPAEQDYLANSFARGANVMVSVSEDNQLTFKNVGAYLAVRLYGEGISVHRVTIRGNNHEKLSGAATVTMALNGDPSVTMAETAAESVSVVCASDVALGTANAPTAFWFVLPPVEFTKGFTITVEDSNGVLYQKGTTKTRTVVRSTLAQMTAFEWTTPAFGIHSSTDASYLYNPPSDQMSVYEDGDDHYCRFLTIDANSLTIREVGPIPANAAVGDSVPVTLTVTTDGTQVSSAEFTLTVRSIEGEKMILTSASDACFVIRY